MMHGLTPLYPAVPGAQYGRQSEMSVLSKPEVFVREGQTSHTAEPFFEYSPKLHKSQEIDPGVFADVPLGHSKQKVALN